MLCGALKSELTNEGHFDYLGMQIEKKMIKVVENLLINTWGMGFILYVKRKKQNPNPLFAKDGIFFFLVVRARFWSWKRHRHWRSNLKTPPPPKIEDRRSESGNRIIFPVKNKVGSWFLLPSFCSRWDFRAFVFDFLVFCRDGGLSGVVAATVALVARPPPPPPLPLLQGRYHRRCSSRKASPTCQASAFMGPRRAAVCIAAPRRRKQHSAAPPHATQRRTIASSAAACSNTVLPTRMQQQRAAR